MNPQAERLVGTKSVQGVSLVDIVRKTLLIKYKFIMLHGIPEDPIHTLLKATFFLICEVIIKYCLILLF